MQKTSLKCWVPLVVLSLLTFTGCTPEKAKTLKAGAAVFANQATLAIDAVSKAIDAEVSVPPLQDPQQTQLFVKNILEYEKTPEALNTFSALIAASDPYQIKLSAEAITKKKKFITRMLGNYYEFNQMFESLEIGSVVAVDAVAKTLKYAQSLVADMVAIGDHYRSNPVKLLGRQGELLGRAQDVLKNETLSTSEKESQLTMLKAERDRILKDEEQMQKNVIESCTKAVAAGLEVQKMIKGYGELQIADLQNTLLRAVGIIGDLTGKDYSNLIQNADVIFDKAKNDPYISTAVGAALEEINKKE